MPRPGPRGGRRPAPRRARCTAGAGPAAGVWPAAGAWPAGTRPERAALEPKGRCEPPAPPGRLVAQL